MSYWNIPDSKPVIALGTLHNQLDAKRAGAAHVIRRGDAYVMVYWGSDSEGSNYILQCETPIADPNGWRPKGKPLISPQPETDHNCAGPGFPFLLPVTSDYHLLYFIY